MDPEAVKKEEFSGRYTRAFLNEVFGNGNWTVSTFDLNKLRSSDGMRAAEKALEDPDLSFAYMSDTKLTCVWLHEYPGWLKFCEPMGIQIKPSPKIAKRLTVMTRTAYLHAKFDIRKVRINGGHPEVGRLNIREVQPHEFSDLQLGDFWYDAFGVEHELDEEDMAKILDGANVISRELVEEMMTNGSRKVDEMFLASCGPECDVPCNMHGRGNPYDKVFYNADIDNTSSMSLRITTPNGLIKGDTLVAPRDRMGGYDVLYCSENIKGELKTRDFVFVLAEPHPAHRPHIFSPDEPAPPPVWSDDQSLSWLGDWLYPPRQLKNAMRDFVDGVERDLTEHRYPRFFTDTRRLDDPYSSIQRFQSQALLWERHGPERFNRNPLDSRHGPSMAQSIFLQERIAQGAINKLDSKRRWPVMCAAYVHVASDSWLHMAGYSNAEGHPWPNSKPETPRGTVWLHEDTGRLVYNDLDFIELYSRHGGWDLDDSVKAHYRTYQGRKVVVIVRSPNSWGEYDIKDYIEGTYNTPWITPEGEEIRFPEVGEGPRPEYLEELDIEYRYESLSPDAIGEEEHFLRGEKYLPTMVAEAARTAVQFRGVFGARANVDMVYFHTIGDYRRKQLAPIEAIVDASTQEQSGKAQRLIVQDTQDVKDEIIQSGKPVDQALWQQRLMAERVPGVEFKNLSWTEMTVSHDDYCSMFFKRLKSLAQRAATQIHPDVMDLGRRAERQGKLIYDWWTQLSRTERRHEDEASTEVWRRINNRIVSRLNELPEHTIYNIILGLARHCYTNKLGDSYRDTPLFQMGAPGEDSIFYYYLDAISFYGIGDTSWSGMVECSNCGRNEHFLDRVQYQAMLHEGLCTTC